MNERTVAAAVERDLAELGKRDPSIPDTALAATALELARQLDDPKNSATSKSNCAKALTEALDRLFELAPEPQEDDEVDRIRKNRASRRGATAAD